jgi:hypothetical protein
MMQVDFDVMLGDAFDVDSISWCYIDLWWTIAVVWLFLSV